MIGRASWLLLACWIALGPAAGLLAAPAQAQILRILPLGDSITQGPYPYRSYRYSLWKSLVNAGVSVDMVGSRTFTAGGDSYFPPYQGRAFDPDHEGHAGWRAQDIIDGCTADDPCTTKNEGTLAQWLTGYTPDIALIHLGTNDILQHASTVVTLASLSLIIDTLRADNPHMLIFLAQITPMGGDRYWSVLSLNAQIATLAASKHTTQSPVILVDHFTGFLPSVHTYDGIHPNEPGEELMAQRWLAAIADALAPNEPPILAAWPNRSVRWIREQMNLIATVSDDGRPADGGGIAVTWTQLSGPAAAVIADPSSSFTDVSFPIPGTYSFQCLATDGELAVTDSLQVDVLDYSCPPTHREIDGRVVMESDQCAYSRNGFGAMAGGFWRFQADPTGNTADGRIARPIPDDTPTAGDSANGPRIDYRIEFQTPGTYTAWVRLRAPAGTGRSIHAGFNDVRITAGTSGMTAAVTDAWQWIGAAGGSPVLFHVPTPGVHTFSLYMREAGLYVDRLLLTIDPQETPAGIGPPSSPLANHCDFDLDLMDDLWELAAFNTLSRSGNGDMDLDGFTDLDEYLAGTDPNNPASFPYLTIQHGNPPTLRFPSATGRVYTLESSDPSGNPSWTAIIQLDGAEGELSFELPDTPPARLYRYRVAPP